MKGTKANEKVIVSYNPKVSLDPKVHYTTQSSAYDRLLDTGPLTNRKIAEYERQGRYGEDAKQKRLLLDKQRREAGTKRADLESRLAMYE